jgi:hypothetical protein
MKKFNSLFYSGLFIILTPLFIVIVVAISSYKVKPPLIETPEKYYDTIKVKVLYYDTIKVKKIQWIEKIKSDTNQIKIEQ